MDRSLRAEEGWARLRQAFAADPDGMSDYGEAEQHAASSRSSPVPSRRLLAALKRARTPSLLFWRGLLRRRVMDYQGAVADLSRARALGERSAALLTWLGEAKLQVGDAEGGRRDLEAALALPDARAWNHAWAGRALMTLCHDREAAALLDRAVALAPRWPTALAWRGEARRRLGDAGGALVDLETALWLQRRGRNAQLARGWRALALLALHKAPQARKALAGLVRLMPDYEVWWSGLAQAEAACGRPARWAACMDRAAALSLKYAQEPGRWSRERLEETLAALERAPRTAAVLRWRGLMRLRLGRAAEALPDLEISCRREPSIALQWLWRAEALAALGRLPEARACARRGGDGVEARLLGGRLAALAGDAKAALAAYDRAERADGRCVRVFSERGSLLLSVGRAAAARADLRRAARLDARDPGTWVDLSEALRRLGDGPESRAALRAARALDPERAKARRAQWRRFSKAAK